MEVIEEWYLLEEEGAGWLSAESAAGELQFTEEVVVMDEVDAFADEVLEADPVGPGLSIPRRFTQWLAGIEGKTWVSVGFQTAMVSIMLYPIIAKAVEGAKATGQRTSLDSAIKGARKTLIENYHDTILVPAQKLKDSAEFSKLPPDVQKEVNATLEIDAETFWIINGPGIMKAYAQSPVFDPTGAAPTYVLPLTVAPATPDA